MQAASEKASHRLAAALVILEVGKRCPLAEEAQCQQPAGVCEEGAPGCGELAQQSTPNDDAVVMVQTREMIVVELAKAPLPTRWPVSYAEPVHEVGGLSAGCVGKPLQSCRHCRTLSRFLQLLVPASWQSPHSAIQPTAACASSPASTDGGGSAARLVRKRLPREFPNERPALQRVGGGPRVISSSALQCRAVSGSAGGGQQWRVYKGVGRAAGTDGEMRE